MNKSKTLVVVLGATATGKTDVGIALARRFGSEIISSDSRQIYREMAIGTAKPSPEQLAAVPHHFIGLKGVTESYSAGLYEEDVVVLLSALFEKHDVVFLVGGSGLYIDAVCQGMDTMPETDEALRAELNRRLEQEGLQSLTEQLRQLDPAHYESIDRSNPQRVVRALEVCLLTGGPYSAVRTGYGKERPFNVVKVGIRMPREVLYDRINRRVDLMMQDGLEGEARALYPLRTYNALQTVGYKELFDYFDGTTSLEQAVELIKRNSRRYAKRQETWFGRDNKTMWFDGGEQCVAEIEKQLFEFV